MKGDQGIDLHFDKRLMWTSAYQAKKNNLNMKIWQIAYRQEIRALNIVP